MVTLTVEEAQARLPKLIDELSRGDEIVITRNSIPVGRLVSVSLDKPRPIAGRGRGKIDILAEDEEHLKDFAEYMP